jgi:NADPH-dependent F420 reductase
MSFSEKRTIAIVGGTGNLGSALAKCWLAAGHSIVIGSRSAEKAQQLATLLGASARGDNNYGAAQAADIVVLTVRFNSLKATISEIKDAVQGKVVIVAVVPLVPPNVSTVQLPPEGSAAQAAQNMLGENVRVVSAFHNTGATKLHEVGRSDCDVLVFGDDKAAREVVIALAGDVATRGVDGGVLANSAAAEAMTSVLIGINQRYNVAGSGIRITRLPPSSAQ